MARKYPKILLLAGWYPHSLDPSDGDFIQNQARMMNRQGIDISVFHSSLSYKYLLQRQLKKKNYAFSSNGLLEYRVESPFWPRNTIWAMDKWARSFAKDCMQFMHNNGRPDLIHAHTYLGGLVARLIKSEFGIPYIVTLHETSLQSKSIPKHHFKLTKNALKEAEQVIAVSQSLAHAVNDVFGTNCEVVPNFIDLDLFQTSPIKGKSFTFIFIGDLIPRKNVSLIISAFASIELYKNANLIIVGEGPDKKSLMAETQRLNLENRIDFIGRCPQEDVADLLANSHCLVLTSSVETFGIVLIESLASGVPVIATPSGGPEDIVTSDVGIFLKSWDQKELVSAMLKIMNQSTNYDAQELRDYVLRRFSAKVVSKTYSKLYNSILKNVE